MNDASLRRRLRALRAPLPASSFDERLEQALLREAEQLRAQRPMLTARGSSARASQGRRARRWGGRLGLGLAITFGASAAAAAVGWLGFAPATDPEPASDVAVEILAPPALNPPEPAPVLPAAHAAVAQRVIPYTPEAREMRESARAVTRPLREVSLSPRPRRHDRPSMLEPFELPATTPHVPAADDRTSRAAPRARDAEYAALTPQDRSNQGRGDASKKRRLLPELEARANRARQRPENTGRERASVGSGQGTIAERSKREGADRGRERAKEMRERNGK